MENIVYFPFPREREADGERGNDLLDLEGAMIFVVQLFRGSARFDVAATKHYQVVTARRRHHHLSRTTRVWNVLDGAAQVRFGFWIAKVRVLDCTAREGFGFWGSRCAARKGSGCAARKGSGCAARKGSGCAATFWWRGEERF